MTRILIPRSDNISAKTIESSDWEKYFTCDILTDYIICGLAVTAQCPNILAVDISAGNSRLKGLHLNNSVSCSVTCLTACSANYLYAAICRDPSCEPEAWSFSVTLSATPAIDTLLLSKITTNACSVTCIDDGVRNLNNGHYGQSGDQLYPLNTAICCYTTPCAVCASSTALLTADAIWGLSGTEIIEDFTTYTTQCEADTAWPSTDTAKVRVNITNDNADVTADTSNQNDLLSFDIGAANISETAWVLRFKWDLTTVAQTTTGGQNAYVRIGLGSALTLGEVPAIDFIGFEAVYSVGAFLFRSAVSNGGTETFVSNVLTPSAATFYVEISRQSATVSNVKLFSDVTFTTQVGSTAVGVPSAGVASLRYLRAHVFNQAIADGDMTGIIDDVQFWDGVTGISTTPSSNAIDDCVCTRWESTQETNPNINIDMGSNKEAAGLALHIDKTNTTETEIEIRISTDQTFTISERVRTILISDFKDDTWRFISIPRLGDDRRYIQIYGSSGSSFVLSINEIKYLAATDWERLHFHHKLVSDDTSSNREDSN